MLKTLLGLAVTGMQTASLAQKLKQYAIAAALGMVAMAALVAAFVLGGWALFLGFGYVMDPAWAAAAACLVLLLVTFALLAGAAAVAQRRVPDPMKETLRHALPMGREFTRQHPLGMVAGAAVAGAILTALLKNR